MLELIGFFIGFLCYAGWERKNNAFLRKCFSVHGLLLFRTTMLIDRIETLLFRLLFDDETTHDERIKSDCFTHIREI